MRRVEGKLYYVSAHGEFPKLYLVLINVNRSSCFGGALPESDIKYI